MILLAFLLLFTPVLRAQDDPGEAMEKEIKKVVDVFVTLDREAADPVSADQALYQGAIPGMLKSLDPHSIFFDPDQFEQMNQMQRSEQKGFGTVVSVLPGRVIVLQATTGTPSAKAGLSAGDEILAVNNIVLARLETDQLIQVLGQARQQQATLDVRRPGNARLVRITLTPELVDTPSVDRAFLLAPGLGYIRITGFEQSTGKLVKESIEKLGGESLKGLVIDLRDNPGGAVQAAVETASLFLNPEKLIFTIKGRNMKDEEARVPKFAKPYAFPVAMLVDDKTASASEILSGALQDHDRAVILGEPSYGKGLVQNVFPLSGNTGLALTIAFYYTPSGRSIQKPLASGQLDVATIVPSGTFHTDAGREVQGGGGIQPDEVVHPAALSRLSAVLDATGYITTFAGEFLRTHDIGDDFEVTPAMLDELQVFLSSRNIRPGIAEWLSHREWLQSRLKEEIFNLKFGVAKGDEIGMQRDAVVQHALVILRSDTRR